MAKRHAVALRLVHPTLDEPRRKFESLDDKLNDQVLRTIEELRSVDPGIEDEYEFEIFGNTGPTPPKKK